METLIQHLDPPTAMYPARLDEKGRLKLPTAFQTYFSALPERKLFATSLDRRTAQVYPMSEWRDNIKFLQSHTEHARAARRVAFNAADLGSESEMDGQGRIQFSVELRRALEIENQPVHVFTYKGRLEVLPEKVYEEMKKDSGDVTADDISDLEAAGLK